MKSNIKKGGRKAGREGKKNYKGINKHYVSKCDFDFIS